jgi:hypothetical protein
MKTDPLFPAARGPLRLRCECALTGEEREALERWEEELLRLVQACDEGGTRRVAGELRAAVRATGEALKAVLAPLLLAQLEMVVGEALAPFYWQHGDAARAYHQTDAARALLGTLAPAPEASARELPGQAERLLLWVRSALAGRVEWEFEGVEA